MGCFGFSFTKLETYVRMRNYLRGKLEERRVRKLLKEQEELKRKANSGKADVSEKSASTLTSQTSMLSGDTPVDNNVDVDKNEVDNIQDNSSRVDSLNNNRVEENRSKGSVNDDSQADVDNTVNSKRADADSIGIKGGHSGDSATMSFSAGRKVTFGLADLGQSSCKTTTPVEVEDDISAINRRIKKMIMEQSRRKAEAAGNARTPSTPVEATRYCSSSDFSAEMQPLSHRARSNTDRRARCIRM